MDLQGEDRGLGSLIGVRGVAEGEKMGGVAPGRVALPA